MSSRCKVPILATSPSIVIFNQSTNSKRGLLSTHVLVELFLTHIFLNHPSEQVYIHSSSVYTYQWLPLSLGPL